MLITIAITAVWMENVVMSANQHQMTLDLWIGRMYIDSWRLRSFELSLEGERVLKIQSESNKKALNLEN